MTRKANCSQCSISLAAKLFTTGAGSEQGSSGAFLHRLCIILETVSAVGVAKEVQKPLKDPSDFPRRRLSPAAPK